jgi:hypothetical protein
MFKGDFLSKRVFKKEVVKKAVKNIANDFRYSNDLSDYAQLFYRADRDGEISGGDIDLMIEYIETGLKELEKEFQHLQWRHEFMHNNPTADEIQVIENLKAIKTEYSLILKLLK